MSKLIKNIREKISKKMQWIFINQEEYLYNIKEIETAHHGYDLIIKGNCKPKNVKCKNIEYTAQFSSEDVHRIINLWFEKYPNACVWNGKLKK